MNILADENIDGPIVRALRNDGHTVLYIAEVDPSAPDDVVLAEADAASALLLTADTDFGELVFRQGNATNGVLLIRLAGLPPHDKATLVSMAIARHGDEMLSRFSVLTQAALRVRRL